ncbi:MULTISPECIES: hypothetical protein [unclassified Nocardiopsis]|uniref:DUF7224 domain-containing protein n=1 Tax=unclassified Nocardiopsis TaxID=2649073 RepID=UPI001357DF8E|nr:MULTISPECIES: hypothetical protein [unclassified Nocardiopsis]
MTTRKRWITSLSLWLALPMIAFVVSINMEDGLQFATRGYWLTATTVASEAVSVTGVVAALGATWEASRLRRARVLAITSRNRLLVVAETLVPTVVVVLMGTLVSYAMMATIALGAPGGPAWHVIAVNLAALTGILGWGLFLGFALPPTLALAVCLASTYVWYFVTAGSGSFPLWARYLSGGFLGDPSVWGAVDPRALGAALVSALGLAAAGLCAVLLRDRGRALLAGPLAVVMAVGVGCWVARPLDHHPVVPRTGIECDAPVGGVTVCLWPELAADHEALVSEVVRQHRTFSALGLEPPSTVSAAMEEPEGSMWIPLVPRADPRPVVAAGFVEAFMPAALPDSCEDFPENTVVTVLAWLRTVAQTPDHEEYRASIPAEPARYLDGVLDLPPRAQGEWYLANRPVLETCSPDPDTLDPRHFEAGATS